jgi:protease-4
MFVMCNKKRVIKMSISNLYSLLNTPFYIEQNYGSAQLPLLLNILNGTSTIVEKKETENNISFHSLMGSSESVNNSVKQVAILSIKNPIVKHDQFCGPQGTKSMTRELLALEKNDSVAGVVLDIDSGGGQAYGTPEFHDFLKEYTKPIVAYTDGLMCSAAYYIGSAASHIIANKRAEAIGSIGAYTQILDVTGHYEKQGAKIHTIYATNSTEKNIAYREALQGNYDKYIKQELDPLVATFISDMQNARPSINEDVFKGATFNAKKSLKLGLIDSIGTLQNAIDKVFELSAKNTNTNSTKKMSKDFKNIQAALGLEVAFESNNDAGFFLSENDMETINGLLGEGNNEDVIAGAVTAATTPLTAKITELEATVLIAATSKTAIESALKTALASAEIENADTLTSEEAIAQLSAKVAEYGGLDGATTTAAINDANDNNIGEKNIVGGMDISAAMNN